MRQDNIERVKPKYLNKKIVFCGELKYLALHSAYAQTSYAAGSKL